MMKKIMTIVGWIAISPVILVETLIKIVWGIMFYGLYPLWKCIFSVGFLKRLEAYTHFEYEYILVPKLFKLWET